MVGLGRVNRTELKRAIACNQIGVIGVNFNVFSALNRVKVNKVTVDNGIVNEGIGIFVSIAGAKLHVNAVKVYSDSGFTVIVVEVYAQGMPFIFLKAKRIRCKAGKLNVATVTANIEMA